MWNWNLSNHIKLSLAKNTSPAVDFKIRIESDNNWKASWSLINEYATGSFSPWKLLTTNQEISVPFETIEYTETHGETLDVIEATTVFKWIKFKLNNDVWFVSVEKNWSCSWNIALLFDENFDLLEKRTFDWNIATFIYDKMKKNSIYYVSVYNNWTSFNNTKQSWITSFPYLWSVVDILQWQWGVASIDTFYTSSNSAAWTSYLWYKLKPKSDLFLTSVLWFYSWFTHLRIKNSDWKTIMDWSVVWSLLLPNAPCFLEQNKEYVIEIGGKLIDTTTLNKFGMITVTNKFWLHLKDRKLSNILIKHFFE